MAVVHLQGNVIYQYGEGANAVRVNDVECIEVREHKDADIVPGGCGGRALGHLLGESPHHLRAT